MLGSLLPLEGKKPKFAQIYIIDSEPNQQIEQRFEAGHQNIEKTILRDLQAMIQRVNPHYETYKTAKERMVQNADLQLKLTTFDTKRCDPRLYNLPTAALVGIVIAKNL